jgi:hypothetical protein
MFYMDNIGHPAVIGATMEYFDGRYYFAGGTSPTALLQSLLFIVCYRLLLGSKQSDLGRPFPGVVGRFVAFWLDFVLAISCVAPILGIVPALAEWSRTGSFEWNFERTEAATFDGFVTVGMVLLAFAALFFYFAWPLIRQRPSPGTCIIGYQVIADDGEVMTTKMALKRTAHGFLAVGNVFRGLFGKRDRERGKFWLDEKYATRAVKLL